MLESSYFKIASHEMKRPNSQLYIALFSELVSEEDFDYLNKCQRTEANLNHD